jgi:integrase/recombinase XerC/integrase/recombinase XerD
MKILDKQYRSCEANASATRNYIGDFINELDRGIETKRVYRNALTRFLDWAEDMPLSTPVIRTFKTFLLNKGLAPNSVSVYLVAIRQFLSYLIERGMLHFNPAKEVKRPRVPKTHQRNALTAENARNLLDIVSRKSLKGSRDFAMINLMLRTGIREIEVSRALVGDIAEKEGERILEIHGKGRESKDSFVVLTDEAYQPIEEYLALRSDVAPSTPLFISVGNRARGGLSTRRIRSLVSGYLESVYKLKRHIVQ